MMLPRHRARRLMAGCLAGAALVWGEPAGSQTPDRAQQIIEMQLRSRETRPEGVGMSGREADAIYDKYITAGEHRAGGAAAPATAAATPGQ